MLQTDAANVKPGLKGNLIVTAFASVPRSFGAGKAKGGLQRFPVATLPAIPF